MSILAYAEKEETPEKPNLAKDPSTSPSLQAYTKVAGGRELNHYAQGDVLKDFTLRDQYKQDVYLSWFCGQRIILVRSSFTQSSYKKLDRVAQEKQNEYGSFEFQYIKIMSGEELSTSSAGSKILMEWVNEASMQTIPFLNIYESSTWKSDEVHS
jgi:hypothetical protein